MVQQDDSVTARGVQEGGQEQQSAPTGERDGKGGQVPRLLGKQEKGVEKSGKAKHGEEHGEGTAKLGAKAGQATAHGNTKNSSDKKNLMEIQ